MTESTEIPPLQAGFLVFPRLTLLDLTGPWEVLSRLSNSKCHLISKSRAPVASDSGVIIMPTTTYADCPDLDMICVPGGPGQIALMDDEETLEFLRRQALNAQWITSVCTGSLVLGAAGLLMGYQSACHWMSRDQLEQLGAIPVNARVVVDRNRISGGGVTAGIDFALQLAAEIRGEQEAKGIQLQLEYNPTPPFQCGSPETAGQELADKLRQRAEPMLAARREATRRARQKLGLE